MADLNYMNPGSLDPGLGFKPTGFLGGMEWQKRNKMFEDAVSLQQLSSMRAGEKQGMELDEFKRFAPTRDAKNLSDLMTHRAEAETVGPRKSQEVANLVSQGALHDAQTEKYGLDNQHARATQSSKIDADIAENITRGGTSAVTQMKNITEASRQAAIQIAQGGPQATAQVMQTLSRAGMPMDQLRQFVGDGRPQTLMTNLKKFTDLLLRVDQVHQSKMAEIKQQGANQLAVQGSANAGGLAIANVRSTATRKNIKQLFDAAKDPTDKIMKGIQILSVPGLENDVAIEVQNTMKAAWDLLDDAQKVKIGPLISSSGIVPPQLKARINNPVPGSTQGPTATGSVDYSKMTNEQLLEALKNVR